LQQQRIGYAHTRIVERQAGEAKVYVSTICQEMTLSRGTTSLKVRVDQEIEEDAAGRLVRFTQKIDQGRVVQESRGEVEDGKLVVTMGSGRNAQVQSVPAPVALCPWAAEQVSRVKGYEPGTAYELTVFKPEAPTTPMTVSITVGEKEPLEVFEVTRWLHRVESELPGTLRITIVTWVDDEGQPWLARTKLSGLFEIELRRVTREMALQPPEKGEILLASAIAPDRPIPRPRKLEALAISLSPHEPSAPAIQLPADPFQQVKRKGNALLVRIRRAHGDAARSYQLPYAGKEHAALLAPTAWLETRDPLIIQMSEEAVGGETDALKAARRIEAYVGRVVEEKTLGMGFATALETARQKAGDCTEHAVLTAALARAAGMPSRVVTGLAYGSVESGDAERKFYYHMWTEVYVGQWLPLDAALGSHDATHITIGRSGLDGPDAIFDLASACLKFMGTAHIKVVEFDH